MGAPITTRRAAAAANPVEEFLAGAKVWVDTYANGYPWWSGSLLPPEVRRIFFNATPVAVPEPSTWAMGLAGLAFAGVKVLRRRRRIQVQG